MNILNKTKKRLTRSNHRIIGGVIAGLANYFGMDVTVARILYIILSVLSIGFPGTLVYIILWMIMPKEKSQG